jgi:hypothetical protein
MREYRRDWGRVPASTPRVDRRGVAPCRPTGSTCWRSVWTGPVLGPAWYDALGSDYGKAALKFLAHYADPTAVIRLGQARLSLFLRRHSRGHWREEKAAELVAAAKETLQLWGADGMNYPELAADIAVEAEQAQVLTLQMTGLDQRIATMYANADPAGIIRSAPGVGPVIAK